MKTPQNFSEFQAGLDQELPPLTWPEGVLAMWYDGKGNWEKAHDIAQDLSGTEGDLIHAYLHRKEGDDSNASYWYRRAGHSFPAVSLEEEFERIVKYLIERENS